MWNYSEQGVHTIFRFDYNELPRSHLGQQHNSLLQEEPTNVSGKWMDGWETRRKRIPGHDFCIIKLGLPGNVSCLMSTKSGWTV